MGIFSILGGLSPIIQFLVVVGLFTILIIAACSRKAAINLVLFLHDIGHVVRGYSAPQASLPGDYQKRNIDELGINHQEQTRERSLNP